MNARFKLILIGALCTLALPTWADTPKPRVELTREHFDHIDTDRSGSISEAEYLEFMEAAFKKLDADGSGGLTLDEVHTLLTPAQFQEVDQNNDGKITLDELIEHVMKDFHRYDANNDGELQP
ncbi:EF-hand domain-containing protein [Yanghanlia caeni]|uniref:EF-hand domain-containing protein n=1 Tax=Yanghanlia caeni TaxID=3064283 RepID=A0ABU1D3F4_9BURK|nr:EF-hand domain-containing protein [Alcaligenaceae bacterium LG-2]HZH56426.1 EF-hand domain-containing protein [Burkholderiaceae bacterium]